MNEWMRKWQPKYIVEKHEIVHFGRKITKAFFFLMEWDVLVL